MRTILLKYLSFVFRMVKTPASIDAVISMLPDVLVVVPGKSLLVEGLLYVMARSQGLSGTCYLGGKHPVSERVPLQNIPIRSGNNSFGDPAKIQTLNWIDADQYKTIAELLSANSALHLATLNLFHVKGPVRNPPQRSPGIFWHFGLLFARRMLIVVFGTPFRPAIFKPADEAASPPNTIDVSGRLPSLLRLRRAIKVDFYLNLKIVRGTPFQNIEAQERICLSGPEFEREIKIVAERSNQSPGRTRRAARRAFYQMAANPRRPMYSILAIISRIITSRLFTEVVTHGLDRLVGAIRHHPVVLVPMHRSHLDYILIGYKLYEANVNPPLVAAGINLSFWPIGFVIRSVGSYFVKRNARDRLHTLVLKRYVTYLIKRGHLQEFFIEGGRSRSGKMMQPKLGLIGIFADAWRKGLRRDIMFVPVSITYENVVEEASFGEENTGRSKSRESLFSLIRALDIFSRRYGEVVINFGPPIALSKFVSNLKDSQPKFELIASSAFESQSATAAARSDLRLVSSPVSSPGSSPVSSPREKPREERYYVQELAAHLTRAIRDQTNPSLTALTCTALMSAPRYGMLRTDLVSSIHALSSFIQSQQGSLKFGQFTPALASFLAGRDYLLNDLARGSMVSVSSFLETQAFAIPGKRRFSADFYRNSTIHLFLPLGLYSLLEMLDRDLSVNAALEFYPLFAHDLLLPPPHSYESVLSSSLSSLMECGAVAAVDTEHGASTRFISRDNPLYMPGLLIGFLESLLWVHHNLQGSSAKIDEIEARTKASKSRTFAYGEFLDHLQREFRIASYLGLVSRTEAASRSSLQAAIDALVARQIIVLPDGASKNGKLVLKQECHTEVEMLTRITRAFRNIPARRGTAGLTDSIPAAVSAAKEGI